MTDFRVFPPRSFEAVITDVDGDLCRMATTLKPANCIYRFYLDQDIRTCEIPYLTFPMDVFINLRTKTAIPDFLPITR